MRCISCKNGCEERKNELDETFQLFYLAVSKLCINFAAHLENVSDL